MIRGFAGAASLIFVTLLCASAEEPLLPEFGYDVARTHELQPHHRTIHLKGVEPGFNQLRLQLTVARTGDVTGAHATGDKTAMTFWEQVRNEVMAWKFTPFEKDGKAVAAQVEEYVDLVPEERFPTTHVAPPIIRPDSKIAISLKRSGCLGTCPSYTVALTNSGVSFEGDYYVVASGTHTAHLDYADLRQLAARFVSSDFYSMDAKYEAGVTDCPTYKLSIEIDGRLKEVIDYMGDWEGMPEVVRDLESAVDELAETGRWVSGNAGLVDALKQEKFDFNRAQAQDMLKQAALRGESTTVQEFLEAGVPLRRMSSRKTVDSMGFNIGLLQSASSHLDVLKLLTSAGVSRHDQSDKDLALVGAVRSGNVEAARLLIAYGANPNADLRRREVVEENGTSAEESGAGSVLLYAAASGYPEMVKEILRYHPKLEARDHDGNTALIAAADDSGGNDDGAARAECVRLLVKAGADVNARNNEGNTALHETFFTEVEQALLELGADVNARNKDGETPIFTTVDDTAITLYVDHGADLTIRNKDGKNVIDAASQRGPARADALRKALETATQK